jgi:hypothetical protein
MKNLVKTAILSAALAALMLPARAQSTDDTKATKPVDVKAVPAAKKPATIDQRKENQQQRIGEGVENGSLTAGEAARLEKKEAGLNKEERKMKSDGDFTAAERTKVQHQQNKLSRRIYHQKHDAQVRPEPRTEIGARKQAQQQRIGEGIENGSLTPGEAARLEKKEVKLNQETRAMRAENGGRLTPADKAKVHHQQNHLSRQIHHQKHDGQHR